MTMKITLEIENGEDVLRELCSLAMDEIQGNGSIEVKLNLGDQDIRLGDIQTSLTFHYKEWRTCGVLTDLRVSAIRIDAWVKGVEVRTVTFLGVTNLDEHITNFLKNHML